MFNIERQEEIMQLLYKRKSLTVRGLSQLLFISESTVRRDLRELERGGRVRRTFGGVVLEETLTKEVPLLLRKAQNHEAKRVIAEKAKRYVENGQVLFLDASSTVSHLIPLLEDFSDLTVITNSPHAATELGNLGIRTLCTGGLLLAASQAFVGPHAEDFVRRFNADAMFFSSRGISRDGRITDSSLEESRLRQIMLEQSKKHYYLYDTAKIGKEYLYNLCTCENTDACVNETDFSLEELP